MRNVTPENNYTLVLKSLGLAIGTVSIMALMKIALDAFISVSGFIIPFTVVYFLLFKYRNKN